MDTKIIKLDYRDPMWVAKRLGLDKNTVYKFLQEGTLPAIQLGRKWLVSESQLTRWLAEETLRQTSARRQSGSVEQAPARSRSLSARSRALLRDAYLEARRRNHRHLGIEHLLLALAGESTLIKRGWNPPSVRDAIEHRLPAIDPETVQQPGRKPRAKRAIQLAKMEARRGGANSVEPDHLLLGILLTGEGTCADLLRERGLDVQALRKQLSIPSPNEASSN